MLRTWPRLATLTLLLVGVFAASPLAAGDTVTGAGGWLLVAANTLPLLALRRNPLLVVLTFAVAYPLWVAAGQSTHILQSLPTLVAMYATGSWDRPLWVRSLALLSPAWMVTASLVELWPSVDPLELGLELGFVAVVFVVVWALGVVVAERGEYAAELEARTTLLEDRTAQLEEARRELADRAVADERARIARELHDVIAHAMSVITVQAGVARHLAGDGADTRTTDALGVIEDTGREALAEMRRMLSVLRRADDGDRDQTPRPGVATVPTLVDQARAAGIGVTYRTEGPVRPLPPGLDLALYRVVQEALTNVVKHAPGSRALVTLRYRPDEVEAEVRNGGAAPAEPFAAGQGLQGMRERVALYDGELSTGSTDDGFRVAARFPVGTAP